MFGETFQFTNPPKKATPGEYDVVLDNIAERNLKGYNVLTFRFHYKDGEERVPNSFDLFDVVNRQDEKERKAFDVKMSKIALCFGLKGSFSPMSYEEWKGHGGRIVIRESENGFLNVVDFISAAEVAEKATVF